MASATASEAAGAGAGREPPGPGAGFHRSAATWRAYATLAFYGYALNALGPVTPFLRDEQRLSYFVAGLHSTAFALGILVAGLASARVVARVGRGRALALGVVGVLAGAALLVLGRRLPLTLGGTALMGTVGSLILAVVASSLSDEHGPRRAVALTEANLLASVVSALAGAAVGLSTRVGLGWRGGLVVPLLLAGPALLWRRGGAGGEAPARAARAAGRRLPAVFWMVWAALVAGVSIEFCCILWSGGFVKDVLGAGAERAAVAPTAFLAGMVGGRVAGSWLTRRSAPRRLVYLALAVALVGFLAYWRAGGVLQAYAGLLVCGLGVANLYPLLAALALEATADSDAAAARVTLASGVAIAALPLGLARLADAFGLRAANGLVLLLVLATAALVKWAGVLSRRRRQ